MDYQEEPQQKELRRKLLGKTIKSVEIKGIEGCDDRPYLILKMTDETIFTIVSDYDGYTGNSKDEYRRIIEVVEGEA